MQLNAKNWIRYWRASLADSQCVNPDWKKHDLVNSAGAGGVMLMSREDWDKGQLSDQKVIDGLFHKKTPESSFVTLAVYPSLYARAYSHAVSVRDGLPAKMHTYTARVMVSRQGVLSVSEQNDAIAPPIVNRSLLSPLDIEAAPLVVGTVQKLDAYLTEHPCSRGKWQEFLKYCDALESHACDLQILTNKGYVKQHPVSFLNADDQPLAAQLLKLYDAILEHDVDLPLLQTVAHCQPRERPVPGDGDVFGKRSGHMHPDHPLAAAQRMTLGAVLSLQSGECLAVSGPPGTGKTTLLQSVVAAFWIGPILGDDATPEAPVIAACSTNNQAVTNIIESFETVPVDQDNPLAHRWVPAWSAFGVYMVRDELAKKTKYVTKQKLADFEYGAASDISAYEQYFLDRFRTAFPDQSVTDISSCSKYLRAQIRAKHAWLDHIPSLWRSLCVAVEEVKLAAELFSADEMQWIAFHENAATTAEQETRHRGDQETQWIAVLGASSFLSNAFAWIPLVAASRDMKALAFLRGIAGSQAKAEKGLYKKLMKILEDRTADSEKNSLQLREIENDARIKIVRRDHAQLAWSSAVKNLQEMRVEKVTQAPSLDDHSTLEDVDRICDTVVRRHIFLLATHYWEARWLECLKATVVLDIKHGRELKDKRKRIDKPSTEAYRRRAMICPVFVSTFHSLPDNFAKFSRLDNGAWQLKPFWNFIDLLVIDEAGQVAPEIGAGAFALARKAVVVGDALQIEPVWNIHKSVDLGNAQAFELLPATKVGRENFLTHGMAASNGSLIKLAQRASPYHQNLPLGRGMHLYEHRRCDDAIIAYCNDLCYQGALIPKRGNAPRPDLQMMHLPALGYARVPGREERPSSGSVCNPIEAAAVARWIADNQAVLESFYAGQGLEKIVAVITPYRAQKDAIVRELAALGLPPSITVGTVHSLQGAERPVVLFSPANSHHAEKKFLFWNAKPNLLNVVVSRAKDSFLVFSDMSMFEPSMATPAGILGKLLLKSDDNEVSVNVTAALQIALKRGSMQSRFATSVRSITTIDAHRSVLRRAFERSQSTVVLTSPWITEYAVRYDGVVDLVKAASQRGVNVTIYTDSILNAASGEAKVRAFERVVAVLSTAGAKVVPVKMIHSKVLYCDDDWKCVGSFNWLSAHREGSYARHDVSTLIEGAAFVAPDKFEEQALLEGLKVQLFAVNHA